MDSTNNILIGDYTVNTRKFEKGTYGAKNNMNYPNVKVTNPSIEELVKKWVA